MIAGSGYIGRLDMKLDDTLTSGETVDQALSRLLDLFTSLKAEHDATQAAIAAATGADGTLKRAVTYS